MDRSVLAVDYGSKRTGLAIARYPGFFVSPLFTIKSQNSSEVIEKIKETIDKEDIGALVIGIPRDMNGNETAQTVFTRSLIVKIKAILDVKVYTQDETLSSVRAEQELESKKKLYLKEDVDKLAAAYILEDWLKSNPSLEER